MLRRLTYHMLMIPTITTTMIVLGLCIMGTVAMRGKGRHKCTVDIEESGKQRLLQQRMSSDELTHTNCHSGCHPLSEMSLKATSDHRKFLDLQAMLFATGIEHQPGPINWLNGNTLARQVLASWTISSSQQTCKSPARGFHLEVGNITCLNSHLSQVSQSMADAFVFQEHSCPQSEWAKMHKYMTSRRKKVILSKLDPEVRHNLGGLGILTKHTRKAVKIKAKTKAFEDAVDTGRAEHYALDIGHATTLSVFNIYGWTGAHQSRKQALRTDHLIAAINDEVHQQPDCPVLVVGDLNGDPNDFKTLSDMLDHEGWTDIGAQAHIWNQPRNHPTCRAPNSETATRRDYVFANGLALQLITDFKVEEQLDFPVHSFLKLTLSPGSAEQFINKDIRPKNLTQHFEAYCDDISKHVEDAKTKEGIRDGQIAKYHREMDARFRGQSREFHRYLQHQDTTSSWQMWNNIVEESFCNIFVDKKMQAKFKGRGHNNIKRQRRTKVVLQGDEDDACELEVSEVDAKWALHQKQLARCKQWLARLNRIQHFTAGGCHGVQAVTATHSKLNKEAARCIHKDLDLTNAYECEVKPAIFQIDGSHPSHLIQVRRMVAHFSELVQKSTSAKLKADDLGVKAFFGADRFHTKAYRLLANVFSPPITFLRRPTQGPGGEAKGSFATAPEELDGILTQAWQTIYQGTERSLQSVVDGFMVKYHHHLVQQPEFVLGDIDAEAFRHTCVRASNSAGGLDGWDPIDFKLISPLGFSFLVDILNTIERGAPWPNGVKEGRLAFLAKDPSETEEPLSYRPLLVLPHLYRRWAAHRLQCLPSWIQTWSNDSMYAGIPDRGAEDAWWLSSVSMETWQAKGIPFSGSSADIAKCFDQLIRPLVYAVARTAGMPSRVLLPYQRYMEELTVRNSISGSLGKPYVRRCGIPQGCPLSMMFLALVLRPWTLTMQSLGATPRILADDLMLLTSGNNHVSKMQRAINATHELLQDMGAQIAPKKSFIFSNRLQARKWYASHTWVNISTTIPVVKSVRDLGGTISTMARGSAKVIDARITQSLSTLRRFRFLPHANDVKARFIHCKVLQAALYGIECAEPSGHLMRKLQTSITQVIGSHSARACNTLTFEVHNYANDLDPHVHQCVRRLSLLRRMWAKYPHIRPCLHDLWDIYHNGGVQGTIGPDQEISPDLLPAPPPGHSGRAVWKPTKQAHGPFSLVLFSVSQVAGALDRNLRLHRYNQDPLDLVHMPYQLHKAQLEDVAVQARMSWTANTRQHLHGVGDIDRVVLRQVLAKRNDEDRRILNHTITLASWANDKLCEAGFVDSPRCELCGHDNQTTMHLLHICPALAEARKVAQANIPNININDLPPPIQLGIPLAMACTSENTFWGSEWSQLQTPSNEMGCFNRGNEMHKLVQDKIAQVHRDVGMHYAKDVIAHFRGTFMQQDFPVLEQCNDIAPNEPNCYSDGGASNPQSHLFSLGTFGVHWPGRTAASHPFNEVEQMFAVCDFTVQGANLRGCMDTPACSSTRAELVAGIVALCAHGPIHFATDSGAFIMRATTYCEHIRLSKPQPKWSQVVDGDLWKHFWLAVMSKGPNSVRMTKVKGHASIEDVIRGVSTPIHKHGNDLADSLATKARQERSDQLSGLCDYFANRQTHYVKFMFDFHSYLLHMVRAISDARNQHHKRACALGDVKAKTKISNRLPYADLDNAVQPDLQLLTQEAFNCLSSSTKFIIGLLTGWTWALSPNGQPGCSWLELFILFWLQGGTWQHIGLSERGHGQPKHSLKSALGAFTRIAKSVIKLHLVAHSQVFFKPATVSTLRCRTIGYSNHCACLVGFPALNSQQAMELTKHMVALRHTFTNNSSKNFETNLLELPMRRFSYRGSVPSNWVSSPTSSFPSLSVSEVESWLKEIGTPDSVQANSLYLHCPLCKHPKDVWGQQLLKGTAWRPIACLNRTCRNSRTAAKWTCPCNKLWYLCAEHAPIGHLSGSAPRSKPEQRPKGGEKRQLNTQHVDQLDEPCRKRQQADGHDHSHRRVRKRNLANSQEKNTKKHKKGTDQDAIDAINRLRAARLHLSSSGPGVNDNL